MPPRADNVLALPPRPISQWERTLLAEWLTATRQEGLDIARAFVSERRGDDPKIHGRIAVMLRSGREPAHLLYSPQGSTSWVLVSAPNWSEVARFCTLRGALNAIRPVLADADAGSSSEPVRAAMR